MFSDNIFKYAEQHSSPQSDLLRRLERETWLKVMSPQMISGHLQGNFLELISILHRPKRILEIGTFTGYSAICLAQGLTNDGELHTFERNPELENIILKYVEEAGLQEKVKLTIGDAKQIIPTLTDTYDLIFLDADKKAYPEYYEMLIPLLNKGGVLLADNVLWYGKVTDLEKYKDEETRRIDLFNKTVANDERVETLLLPLRDGIMIIRKK